MKNFFDIEDRLERLTNMGDALVKLNNTVNWENFRESLEDILKTVDNRAGGRQSFDKVLMFKILILQNLYNISDDSLEFQINDRLSFQRFLKLDIGDKVPDAKTIWLFKERLAKSRREKELFDMYTFHLENIGLVTKSGSIVDATVFERPIQKMSKQPKSENKNKERQIDRDANFTRKRNKPFHGYKNHVNADADTKLITNFSVTPASRHDGKEAPNILDSSDKCVYADAAYRGEFIEAAILSKSPTMKLHVIRKHDGFHIPTPDEELENIQIFTIRTRIEHIFGHMTKSMGGKVLRCVGLTRARLAITFKNLAFNMYRTSFLLSK